MKKISYLFVIVMFFAASCKKDAPIADCSVPYTGLLCKVFMYENELCIGYIAHAYDNHKRLSEEIFKTVRGLTDKSKHYAYNTSGLVSEIIIHDGNGEETGRAINTYSEAGQLTVQSFMHHGKHTGTHSFTYENNRLKQENIDYVSGTDTLITYEYDTQGQLWRKSYFLNGNALLNYQIHNAYDNNFERINYYDARHIFSGYRLLQTDADGQPLSDILYGPDNSLIEKKMYVYGTYGVVSEQVLDHGQNVVSYKLYFYSE